MKSGPTNSTDESVPEKATKVKVTTMRQCLRIDDGGRRITTAALSGPTDRLTDCMEVANERERLIFSSQIKSLAKVHRLSFGFSALWGNKKRDPPV